MSENTSFPRMWRCFYCSFSAKGEVFVFSMHVEVFPREKVQALHSQGLLHARGGVSYFYVFCALALLTVFALPFSYSPLKYPYALSISYITF